MNNLIKKILYKKVLSKTHDGRNVRYSYILTNRFTFNKLLLLKWSGKCWDIEKKMWRSSFKFWVFTIFKYEVMCNGLPYYKTKTKYSVKI